MLVVGIEDDVWGTTDGADHADQAVRLADATVWPSQSAAKIGLLSLKVAS